MALAQAGDAARGATAYVTLEPCAHSSPRGPACADALAAAGIGRVVVGVPDPDRRTAGQGLERLATAGVATSCLDHAASQDSLAGYLIRALHGRPHVTLKLATSLDGGIALANGSSRWITGDAARRHVHTRRALAEAILVGGATWRADAPRLDVRLPGLEGRSPERWVLTSGTAAGARTLSDPRAIANLETAQYLYVEGGARTAAGFLSADLVDRLELYTAPVVLGQVTTAIGDIGLTDLASAHGRWRLVEHRRLGSDIFAAYERTRCSPE